MCIRDSSYYRQMQRLYAAICGGYLGIRECDDTYNDWNRKIIDAYRERYGADGKLSHIWIIGFRVKDGYRVIGGTIGDVAVLEPELSFFGVIVSGPGIC